MRNWVSFGFFGFFGGCALGLWGCGSAQVDAQTKGAGARPPSLQMAGNSALPQAEQGRFAIAVAAFDDDVDNNHDGAGDTRAFFLQSLSQLNEDAYRSEDSKTKTHRLQVLKVDQAFHPAPGSSSFSAHEQARAWLAQMGAHVLIWGHVKYDTGKPVALIHLTGSRDQSMGVWFPMSHDLLSPTASLSTLRPVVDLAVALEHNKSPVKGRSRMSKTFASLTDEVEQWFASSQAPETLAMETRGHARWILGNAHTRHGELNGKKDVQELALKRLEAAASDFEKAGKMVEKMAVSADRATILNEVGMREADGGKLRTAIALYQDVSKVLTREDMPLDWAMVQTNLGYTLRNLGEREGGTRLLEEAVGVFQGALSVWSREHTPTEWATAHNHLGTVLSRLGERESGNERLKEGLIHYKQALLVWTRERAPLEWAAVMGNLAVSLEILGLREGGTARLKEAVETYRQALLEQSRKRVPLDWAMTQHNLGNALVRIAEREPATSRLEEGVEAYRQALLERTRERVPLDWAMTQNNLAAALSVWGEREGSVKRQEEAIEAYRQALSERTRERVPLDWAATQYNLGIALYRLGELESGTKRLEEAIEAFQQALLERKQERVPLDWAATHVKLGFAYQVLGKRRKSRELVCQAFQVHHDAWTAIVRSAASQFGPGIFIAIKGDLSVLEELQPKNRGQKPVCQPPIPDDVWAKYTQEPLNMR